MTEVDLQTFSMRSTPPREGSNWCRIVNAAEKGGPAKVYIYDEIGFWGTSAKDFAAELAALDVDDIELHVNSPGGSVFDGLAIYATLKNHRAKVTAVVDGLAASAASFILQAADHRQITRNAQVMIHDAKAYAGGTATQMRKAAELLDRVSDNIADIYQVRSGQGTVDSWRKIMQAGDEWYSGNEALDAGLVDEVTDNPETDDEGDEEVPSNSWSTKEIENFFKADPLKLAEDAGRSKTSNRVKEAQMSGTAPNNKTEVPPAVPQPPAPAAPIENNASAPSFSFMVNGAEVSDFAEVQAHIASLETFKAETVSTARKEFVASLASEGRILANEESIAEAEALALSLSNKQFASWKATMSSIPTAPMFGTYGSTGGDTNAPQNAAQNDLKREIATLEEIVQSHRDAGMSEERLREKESFKNLTDLKSKLADS